MILNDGSVKKPKRPTPKGVNSRNGVSGLRGSTVKRLTVSELKRRKAIRDANKPRTPTGGGGSNGGSSGSKTLRNKKRKVPVKTPKPPTPSPPKVNPAPLVKTAPTAVPVLSTSFNSNVVEQEQDILSAFLAFSGTELFQYTNQRSVDGMFDDVSIISVLSDRRNGYLPNDIIEIYPQFVKNIYRGTGLDSDKLFIELEGLATSGELLLQFFIGGTVVTTIGSAEYV